MSFSVRTRVAFSDTDAQGIVYYGRYNPYFDFARVEYLRGRGLLGYADVGEFVMRANDVEYFAPAAFDDELEIRLKIGRVGRTSITFEFTVYKLPEQTLTVTAHQTLVYVDLAERCAIPVPEDYKARLVAVDADDVLRDVVARLVAGGYTWAGIFFVEAGELALGPEAGTPDESARRQVPVLWRGERIAELAADGEGAERLDDVAATLGEYCLVGWDTAGEPWEP